MKIISGARLFKKLDFRKNTTGFPDNLGAEGIRR